MFGQRSQKSHMCAGFPHKRSGRPNSLFKLQSIKDNGESQLVYIACYLLSYKVDWELSRSPLENLARIELQEGNRTDTDIVASKCADGDLEWLILNCTDTASGTLPQGLGLVERSGILSHSFARDDATDAVRNRLRLALERATTRVGRDVLSASTAASLIDGFRKGRRPTTPNNARKALKKAGFGASASYRIAGEKDTFHGFEIRWKVTKELENIARLYRAGQDDSEIGKARRKSKLNK